MPPDEWWGPSYDLRGCSTVEDMCRATGQDVTEGRPFEINSLLSGQNDPEATDVLAEMEVWPSFCGSCVYCLGASLSRHRASMVWGLNTPGIVLSFPFLPLLNNKLLVLVCMRMALGSGGHDEVGQEQ